MRMFVRPLALVLLIPALAAAQNWPGYRGPTGQGHAESKDLPAEWTEDKNVAWKVPIDGRTSSLEKYADLMEDPYAARYLRIFCDLSVHHGGAVFMDEKQREVNWLREQKGVGFPVLLEIFKREGDDFERGLPLKRRVLEYFFHFEGDKSGILEEVRRQLPTWVGRELSHDSHTPYVANSLRLLGAEGAEQDLDLLEAFLDDDDGMIRAKADQYLATLKRRLAMDSIHREPRVARKTPSGEGPLNRVDGGVNDSTADHSISRPTDWRWVVGIAIVLLTGCGYLLIKRTTSRRIGQK